MSADSPSSRSGNGGRTVANNTFDRTVVPDQDATVDGPGLTSGGQMDQTFVPPPARADQTVIGGDGADADADAGDVGETRVASSASGRGARTTATAGATNAGPSGGSREGKDASDKKVTQLGDFKLVRKLGQGGMGEVFLAHQISLDRPAALKVLARHLAGKPDFVTRFVREARSMARMDHPNAVRVYAVDQDKGVNYVAMEFIDGKSMQHWVETLGKLTVGDAIHVTLRCSEALAFAHSQNMVHRDIKPDNIMLTSRGAVKVADFGLAKATDDELSMTQSGMGLGTPYYMAPEQARNAKHVDGRADIYALGVTLYHFLTGKVPFDGTSTLEVLQAKERGTFPPARRSNPEVPEKLDLILDKMMAKDPERRFKDFNEVIRQLQGLGLEANALSFIDAKDRVVVQSTSSSSNSRAAMSLPPAKSLAGTVIEGSSASGRQTTGDATQQWFVQTQNAQGKESVARLTTAQIIQALKAGGLSAKSRAKKTAEGKLAPLAYFPEFAQIVQGALAREQADKKAGDMKAMYAKIDRQEKWRKVVRRIKGLFSGAAGMVSFVVYLAILAGVGYGLYLGVPIVWKIVAKQIDEKIQDRKANAPANPGTDGPVKATTTP